MEKYLVPVKTPSSQNPKSTRRHRWKRSLIELTGKFEPNYRHDISSLLMQSYCEIGTYPHSYHVDGEPCRTHVDWFSYAGLNDNASLTSRLGVTSLEFDSKGVYLASVTKSGCLTVHDFDNLHNPDLKEDEAKQLLHISTCQQLDVIRWNRANQDEVACTSTKSSEVHIFDIGYISSEPVEVLRKRPTITVHGCSVHKGLSDIAFSSGDNSRLLASDMNGVINVWDRRVSNLPCLELTSDSNSTLNSIKLSEDNEIIFGASKQGKVYMWDLRGGRSSTAFQNHKEGHYSPLSSVKLAYELEKIWSLKAQSNIVSKEIHSIDIDPSSPHQLAFHLDDGWSGVLDIHKLQVTHIHCPPPPWLDEFNDLANVSYLRKPCWLPIYSVYIVGSSSSNGLHLLDFYPDCSSPCHVDYNGEDLMRSEEPASQHKQNKFLSLSEGVTACAAHPQNGTVVAGTKMYGIRFDNTMNKILVYFFIVNSVQYNTPYQTKPLLFQLSSLLVVSQSTMPC
ncbi:Transducin/WD40 repeat-like superfamily protein [Forsythia ovata]|uniref:Transducin/WD40 repeat-like superfamily protein n=1 Tax=Forsythia ovata TaxID=205694 RepID=A0ABD1NYQ6_9LAMI